jgi:hypothetical protein
MGLGPGLQGPAYFIPTVLVPVLLVTHAFVFGILVTGLPDSRELSQTESYQNVGQCQLSRRSDAIPCRA